MLLHDFSQNCRNDVKTWLSEKRIGECFVIFLTFFNDRPTQDFLGLGKSRFRNRMINQIKSHSRKLRPLSRKNPCDFRHVVMLISASTWAYCLKIWSQEPNQIPYQPSDRHSAFLIFSVSDIYQQTLD